MANLKVQPLEHNTSGGYSAVVDGLLAYAFPTTIFPNVPQDGFWTPAIVASAVSSASTSGGIATFSVSSGTAYYVAIVDQAGKPHWALMSAGYPGDGLTHRMFYEPAPVAAASTPSGSTLVFSARVNSQSISNVSSPLDLTSFYDPYSGFSGANGWYVPTALLGRNFWAFANVIVAVGGTSGLFDLVQVVWGGAAGGFGSVHPVAGFATVAEGVDAYVSIVSDAFCETAAAGASIALSAYDINSVASTPFGPFGWVRVFLL